MLQYDKIQKNLSTQNFRMINFPISTLKSSHVKRWNIGFYPILNEKNVISSCTMAYGN